MTGLILIDKPEGITSFGAVARVRRICKEKKCGHSGTLDPMATGVMTVLLGGATRFCELLPSHDKAYTASFRLGMITDTLDITGKILEEREVAVSEDDVKNAAKKFTGEIEQLPPMYSAVSVNGQRLYELARKGIEAERPTRKVKIFSLEFLENSNENEYTINVECSSGTYIRTLISDIGEKLGCGAALTSLCRTKANGFDISEAVTIEELENGNPEDFLIPVDKALAQYPAINVTQAQAKRFLNGGELFTERLNVKTEPGLYRIYDPEKVFIGIGENDATELLKVRRVFKGDNNG